MSTLNILWESNSEKTFLAQSEDGMVVLIQSKINATWFLGKPSTAYDTGYRMDGSSILLRGDEEIWSEL